MQMQVLLIREKKELCTSVNKDHPVFVLKCCYGSAYGFIWWKFVVKWKEVTCMQGKQEMAAKPTQNKY